MQAFSRIFKNIQRYWCIFIHTHRGTSRIFRDIQRYWWIFIHIHRRVTREEGAGLCNSFLKIKNKCSDFGKKSPDFVHLWVKFPIQNAVVYFCNFLPVFLKKCLSRHSSFTNPSLPWKLLVACLHSGLILFSKTLHLKCLTVFRYASVSITAL